MKTNFKKINWIGYSYIILIAIGLFTYFIDPLKIGRPEKYLTESLIFLGLLTIVGAYWKKRIIEIIKLVLIIIIIVLYYLPK